MTTFDDILSSDLVDSSIGHKAAVKVAKDNYEQLVARRNLTTYSIQQALHECPRKFAIKKMQADAGTTVYRNSPTFAFGHAVGAGVAVYDKTLDLRQAIWAAFLAWDIDLLDEELKGTRKTGKSFHEAIWALYEWRQFHAEETDLPDYEVTHIEATLAVDFEDGHFYSGHVDEILRNKYTGKYRVKENKTTAMVNIDPAMYSNSDQALSYAVMVDMLGGTEYEVMYTVYSAGQQKWQQFSFVKSASKKAEWIQDQLLLHKQIEDYEVINFFPKRGGSCMNFMRRCEFYENCDLSTERVYGKRFDELQTVESLADLHSIEHLDFSTTLTEIVNRQKERLNQS